MAARKGEKLFYFQSLRWTEAAPAHPAGRSRSLMARNTARAQGSGLSLGPAARQGRFQRLLLDQDHGQLRDGQRNRGGEEHLGKGRNRSSR